MALTLAPSVFNSVDLLGKDEIDIFVIMTWNAALSTSRGIFHFSCRLKISVTDMEIEFAKEIELDKLDWITNYLTDNSNKFSYFSNSIPAWL